MADWKVAPSYQHMKMITVDETKHKALMRDTCWKCNGSGQYAWFGTCFACNGAGKIDKWVKAYTEEEYDKYIATQEKEREKKKQAAEDRKQSLITNSEINKKELLEKWGYDPENPLIWIAIGENTYAIKDELKAMGCKFDKILGWYSSQPKDMPEGYGMISISFDMIYSWDCMTKRFEIKEDAKDIVNAAIDATRPESSSEYVGEIKERLRDMEVTLISSRDINTNYGITTIYTFKFNENILVWMTTSYKNIQVGNKILLTGTVKSHETYKGVKQTYLSRCSFKEIA